MRYSSQGNRNAYCENQVETYPTVARTERIRPLILRDCGQIVLSFRRGEWAADTFTAKICNYLFCLTILMVRSNKNNIHRHFLFYIYISMQRLQGVLGARRDGWEKNENKKKKKKTCCCWFGISVSNEWGICFQIPDPSSDQGIPTHGASVDRTNVRWRCARKYVL